MSGGVVGSLRSRPRRSTGVRKCESDKVGGDAEVLRGALDTASIHRVMAVEEELRNKPEASGGTVFSRRRGPTRGAPQVEVPPPLIRMLRVNRAAWATMGELYGTPATPEEDWRVAIQIFAGDISAAISHKWTRTTSVLANGLTDSLLQVLQGLDLGVDTPKSGNCLAKCPWRRPSGGKGRK